MTSMPIEKQTEQEAITRELNVADRIGEELKKRGIRYPYIEVWGNGIRIEVEDPDADEFDLLEELARKLEKLKAKGIEAYAEYKEYVHMIYTYDLVTNKKIDEECADWEVPFTVVTIEVWSEKKKLEDVAKEVIETIRETKIEQ